MTAIGSFLFPSRSTVTQVRIVEAKSKVRKEIQIQSMIRQETQDLLDRAIFELQQAVESFDNGESPLILNAGRYYTGRRREFRITPHPSAAMAWIELWLLTSDRYERSLILHTHTLNLYHGRSVGSLFNQGNWNSPLFITIEPQTSIDSMEITSTGFQLALETQVEAKQKITIDSEKRLVLLEGATAGTTGNEEFPFLVSGGNPLTIQVWPSLADAYCTVQYRDIWV